MYVSRQAPATAAKGFTLVELLLAITLMSILLGLTYSGLRAATRSTERGEDLLAFSGSMRASHQFVRRQLNQMLPLAFAEQDDLDQARLVFLGERNYIQFVAPMPGYLGAGGPQVQVLELVDGEDGAVLQFRHALLQYFEQDRLYDRDPVVLLEDVDSAAFEFIGYDEQGMLTPWMSAWDHPEILPVAVRLQVEFAEGRNLQWPALTAGVRIDEAALNTGPAKPTYKQKIQELMRPTGSTQ